MLLAIVLLGLFTLFSRQVKRGSFTSIDFDTTVRVQGAVAKLDIARFEGFLEDIGVFASPTVSIAGTGVLTLWAAKKRRLAALLIPVAFVLMTIAEIYGKSVVHHPAPPFFLLKNPTTIFPTYHVWEEFSYPSGHAARATFLAIVFWFLAMKQFNNITISRKLWIGLALGVYVGIISLSRIYLGHHWLTDIIGGLVLGSGFALLTTEKTSDGS